MPARDNETLALLASLPVRVLRTRGSKAKARELKARTGAAVNHKRVARICRKHGLLAENRRRRHPKGYYAQQKEERKNLPRNILGRDFAAAAPLRKLCTDVSYFKTREGWLYLSAVMDLRGRRIAGWAVSRRNDRALADETLDRLFSLGVPRGALLHSDMGALYTSPEWRRRLAENGVVQSMSRKGNCWDNACMEHFFGTLKVESGYDGMLRAGRTPTYKETRALVEDFISYYNNERLSENLGWKTPAQTTA